MQSQTNSLSFPVFPGAHTPEIRCQFRAGQPANMQVSHYKTWGHLKALRIFFLPVLFFQFPKLAMFGNTSLYFALLCFVYS